jgi:hypothetical protein
VTRPKATHTGTLLDWLLDCYVLDDDRRVVSQRGVVRALTEGGRERGDLGRYLARLPQEFSHLQAAPEIEFSSPSGPAKGREAQWLVDLLRAYDEADDSGALHPSQRHLARNARRILRALAGVGIIALIDEATNYQQVREATNYQQVREATALSFTFRALLLESRCPWNLMWPADFTESMCRLHGEPFDGTQPRFLASTYEKLYRLVLGDEVYEELKRRNPESSFGTNHHQWLTPEAREVVRKQIPILTALAETVGSKEEFWARVEHRYANKPLQLSWLVPTRDKPPEAAE